MKKYNIYDLSVVTVEKEGIPLRFICKKSIFNNSSFVEVLTGESVVPRSRDDITPLWDFYLPSELKGEATGKTIMLDKNDILRKYVDINAKTVMERKETTYDDNSLLDIENILDKAVSDIFPEKGNWGSACFDRPTTVGIPNIPCNSRNDEWMAKLIRDTKKIYFISLDRIINYLRNSSFYKEKRHQYELEVVRWQIEWMMSGGDNWLVEDEYGGDFIFFDADGDVGFRRAIFKTLTAIGMDPDVVEEGIEKNAAMWRDSWIEKAFRNRFEPILGHVIHSLARGQDNLPEKELPPASDELRSKWIRLRKYEYYHENKDSVDKYGAADDDMMMSEEEAETLRQEVRKLSIERQREINTFKKEREEARKQYQKTKK